MRRTLRLLAGLALITLISAGCSNTPAETGTGSSGGSSAATTAAGATTATTATATTHDQAVKFAECMRANGVREFPDPNASGELTIDAIANGSSVDTSSAAWNRAISACQDLEPPGFTGGKRIPEQQKAALQFAECIRDNGVKDFPDPDPYGPLIDTNRIPSMARNGGRSILRAAMQKCRGLAADAGVKGGQ